MLTRKMIITVLAGLIPTIVKAQPNINSDLKSLIQKSIAYFPKLKEAELGLQAGKEKLEIAKSAYYPNVMLNAGYNY
ncbi:MAG TPA: TolC family protein, partial [Bacteroidia bacterium]|nr:TolC family protein [Bacteroidia bacterium]